MTQALCCGGHTCDERSEQYAYHDAGYDPAPA